MEHSRRNFMTGIGSSVLAVALTSPLRAVAAGIAEETADKAEAWKSVTLVDAQEQATALSEMTGAAVFVHVWANWCPACLGELTSLQELAGQLGQSGLSVLLVSHPKNWEGDKAFLRRTSIRLPAYTLAPDTPWSLREAAFDMTGNTYAVPRTLMFAGRDRRCVLARDGAGDWRPPVMVGRLRSWLS
jgi:thiol-disulfide isomerase/thioredoxin